MEVKAVWDMRCMIWLLASFLAVIVATWPMVRQFTKCTQSMDVPCHIYLHPSILPLRISTGLTAASGELGDISRLHT